MSPKRVTTIASAAVGAAVGVAASAAAVLAAQANQTKNRIGPRTTVPPYHDGRYGNQHGTSIRIAVLGDSAAAGLGAASPADTMGAIIATEVNAATNRPVLLINHAVVGAQTKDLDAQINRALTAPPHVAVIMVGANDITHLVPRKLSQRRLGKAVKRLKDEGIAVVMATCPDLGAIKPFPDPLRTVMRRASAALADDQVAISTKMGATAVPLGAILGPQFDAWPEVFFAEDQFHPSSEGYRAAAELLLPAVLFELQLAKPQLALPATATDEGP